MTPKVVFNNPVTESHYDVICGDINKAKTSITAQLSILKGDVETIKDASLYTFQGESPFGCPGPLLRRGSPAVTLQLLQYWALAMRVKCSQR